MDKERAFELASKPSLNISDWLEITKVPIGRLGQYSISIDGVRFHPNADTDEPGWSEEQITEVQSVDPLEGKHEAQQQALEENGSQLLFPCTPKQLVEFVLVRDVSGDLHGALPGLFIAEVYALDSQRRTNAPKESGAGHLLALAGLLELLLDKRRPHYSQGSIAGEINDRHPDWRGVSTSNLTKLFAEANAAAKDADSDALSKDEARKAATDKANARKATTA